MSYYLLIETFFRIFRSAREQSLSESMHVSSEADDDDGEDEDAAQEAADGDQLPVRHRGFVTSLGAVAGNLILLLVRIRNASEKE